MHFFSDAGPLQGLHTLQDHCCFILPDHDKLDKVFSQSQMFDVFAFKIFMILTALLCIELKQTYSENSESVLEVFAKLSSNFYKSLCSSLLLQCYC